MGIQDLDYGDLVFRIERVCKGSGVDCKVICSQCNLYKYSIIKARLTKKLEKYGLDNVFYSSEEAVRSLIESGVREEDIILNF